MNEERKAEAIAILKDMATRHISGDGTTEETAIYFEKIARLIRLGAICAGISQFFVRSDRGLVDVGTTFVGAQVEHDVIPAMSETILERMGALISQVEDSCCAPECVAAREMKKGPLQ